MSIRQIKKQLDKQKESESTSIIEEELLREKPKAKPTFSAFQMLSSEEEQEDEEIEESKDTSQQADTANKKKKKKRNKKKKPIEADQVTTQDEVKKPVAKPKQVKGKEAEDNAFLDSIIKKAQEEQKIQGLHGLMSGDSVLKMDRKHFNYKKELKSLFAKSAHAYGALGLDEEEKEERRNRGAGDMAEQYENASKKVKRRLKMIERMQDKNRIGQGRKCLLVQPDAQWPKVDKILTMEQCKIDNLQKEFERVQATNDISVLIQFLQKNFYHHESLVYFADFLRIQGKFSDSFHFLERCLFAFESAWCFEYQPVPPEKSNDYDFVPSVRLDLEKEHLNKVFCDCLVKYIDILGRKGCSRTSLEYCKLLLSISPYTDPYGSLLRLDFYALRAHENQLYLDLIRRLPMELYPDDPSQTLLILPNVLLSVGLAKHQILYDLDLSRLPTHESMEKSIQSILSLEGNLNNLLDSPDPETFLIAALLLYPQQVLLLMKKVAQKQATAVTRKSYYTGYQCKSWNDILKHDIFAESQEQMELDYSWVLSEDERQKLNEAKQSEVAEETLNKLYQLYLSRSSSLFTPEPILLWLKEVFGYLLNKLDEGTLDRELLIAKFTSLTSSKQFSLSRYRHLKVSDFTDDITTINANELLMGEQQQQQHDDHGGQQMMGGGQQQDMMAQQQLQQMINQLQQPQMMARGNGLIQERHVGEDGQPINEQEMIAMQEALFAQMERDNEDIHINEDANEGNGQQPGGFINFLGNMIFGNQRPQEEEKKQ